MTARWYFILFLPLFALALSACSSDSTTPRDAAAPDRSNADAPGDGARDGMGTDETAPDEASSRDARLYPTDDSGCTNVTAIGCCLGQVVMWCDKGTIKTTDCAQNATSVPPMPWKIRCGWHPDYKNYDCGYEDEDPSGVNPLWCQGYSPPDAGLPDAAEWPTSECGTIPFQGCCMGTVVKWCSNGEVETVDCADVNDACGWRSEDGYYGCTAQPIEEPSGTYARVCP